jgi:glycosyltransferase involved in cell wall biosynthesis
MKILRIITRLNIGGPSIHVALLQRELTRAGHTCLLATGQIGHEEGNMEYLCDEFGVSPISIPGMGRDPSLISDIAALWALTMLMRKEKPDVVHTHTAKAGTLGRIAAILVGVPVRVHTFHGHVFNSYFSTFSTFLFRTIETFLGLFTHRIIAISELQKKDLTETYHIVVENKCSVIPLGFDLTPFSRIASTRYSREEVAEKLTVGWVGRFVPIKDPQLFVEIVRLMKSRHPEIAYRMFGDGELKPNIEAAIIEFSLGRSLSLTGWQQNVEAIYSDLSLVVLTSLNEGTPVALIEAMSAGIPIIAPAVGGIRDLMSGPARPHVKGWDEFDNGLLMTDRDPHKFAEAISYLLLQRQLRRRMGIAGQHFALSRFNVARLTYEIASLYEHLLLEQAKT